MAQINNRQDPSDNSNKNRLSGGNITLAQRGKYVSVISAVTPDSQKSEKIRHVNNQQYEHRLMSEYSGSRFIMNSSEENTGRSSHGNKYQNLRSEKEQSSVSSTFRKQLAQSAAAEKYSSAHEHRSTDNISPDVRTAASQESSHNSFYTSQEQAQSQVNIRDAVYSAQAKAHISADHSSANISADSTANNEVRYLSYGGNSFAEREQLAEKASAVQEQRKRSAALSSFNERRDNSKKKSESNEKTQQENGKYFGGKSGKYDSNSKSGRTKAENAARYTEYLKGKALYTYQKKVYKVKVKQYKPSSIDKLKGTISLAKRVTDPLKSGDIGKAVVIPAAELVDFVIRKHKGDILLRHRDRLKKGIETAENASDTGTAMYAAAQTIVTDTVKSTASNAVKSLDRAVSNKIRTNLDNKKIQKANKYLNAEFQKANENHQNIYEGKVTNKEIKQLEKFEEQNKDNRLNKKIYNKYMNKSEQFEKLEKDKEKMLKEAAKGQYSKSQKVKSLNQKTEAAKAAEERKIKAGIFNENAKAFAGKTFHAIKSQTTKVIAAGAASVITPIIIILIVIIIIALLFSWQLPFKYTNAAGAEKSAETEAEIALAYVEEIQNYTDIAMMECYITYGRYCDALYAWDLLIPDWDEYFKLYVEPKIEKETEPIYDSYRDAMAEAGKNQDSERLAELGKAMSEEIRIVVAQIMEEELAKYQKIVEEMNDTLGDPESCHSVFHFEPPESGMTEHTEQSGSTNQVLDVNDYNGKTVDGTNSFNLSSLNFDTNLTAEDLFAYVALARAIKIMDPGNEDKEENSESTSTSSEEAEISEDLLSEITPKEINDFFAKTQFIQIESHLTKGDCNGTCHRKLEGDWENGFMVKYFCREKETDEYRHMILSGQITCKNEDELLEAVMEEYKAESAGLTEKDCKDLIKTYKKYLKDTIKSGRHFIGKNDTSRAVELYKIYIGQAPVPNRYKWKINTPLETSLDEDEADKETA